jgi:hypothetical protein
VGVLIEKDDCWHILAYGPHRAELRRGRPGVLIEVERL